MNRQALTDGSGNWIDLDKAESFDEATYGDGSNHISRATGSQWHHERLYRAASGSWVLFSWSYYECVAETWLEVDHETAAAWLVRNGHEHHPELAGQIEELEL